MLDYVRVINVRIMMMIIRPRRSRYRRSGLVIKLSRERSVGRSVCLSVQCIVEKRRIGSDPDAVWHHRSDGSMDEAGSVVRGSVHGKGYFWGRIFRRAIVTHGDFMAYVCDSAATRPSSQITLGRLVISIIV